MAHAPHTHQRADISPQHNTINFSRWLNQLLSSITEAFVMSSSPWYFIQSGSQRGLCLDKVAGTRRHPHCSICVPSVSLQAGAQLPSKEPNPSTLSSRIICACSPRLCIKQAFCTSLHNTVTIHPTLACCFHRMCFSQVGLTAYILNLSNLTAQRNADLSHSWNLNI